MALIVDIRHWLDEHGELPLDNLQVRRKALRIAQLIEAGGPLEPGHLRETLVACSLRPNRKPCMGLLWVEKTEDELIQAYCLICKREEILISGWQDTVWANGPMEPASTELFTPPVNPQNVN
jgi:hypothetical protein